MIDERHERLLQDELDGVNTPERSAAAREFLATGAGGRARMAELESLFHALDQMPLVEAPEDLARSVTAALARERGAAADPAGWRAAWRGLAVRHPMVRFTYPFVAGAAVGIVAFSLATGGFRTAGREVLPVAGSMQPAAPEQGGSLVDQRELRVGDGTLVLETRRSGNTVRLIVRTSAARSADLDLAFDPRALELSGIDWPAAGRGRTDAAPGRLALRLDGQGAWVVRFAARIGDSPLSVAARSGGEPTRGFLHTAAVTATGR